MTRRARGKHASDGKDERHPARGPGRRRRQILVTEKRRRRRVTRSPTKDVVTAASK